MTTRRQWRIGWKEWLKKHRPMVNVSDKRLEWGEELQRAGVGLRLEVERARKESRELRADLAAVIAANNELGKLNADLIVQLAQARVIIARVANFAKWMPSGMADEEHAAVTAGIIRAAAAFFSAYPEED